jgi:hypothetical protein
LEDQGTDGRKKLKVNYSDKCVTILEDLCSMKLVNATQSMN